jgi:translation machinery-associated protein 16
MEVAYIQLLRFIRISSVDSTSAVVSKRGEHHSLKESVPPQAIDEAMVTGRDDTLLIEPPSRFASTMMMMDGPLS